MSFEKRINFETGGNRCDITPVFADPSSFSDLLNRMSQGLEGHSFDLVAGIDALGFVIGGALAAKMGKGFLPIRKGGKLPVPAVQAAFQDYSGEAKKLEIALGAVPKSAKILLVDDWIETGSQVRAAIELLEGQEGRVVAIAAVKFDKSGAELGLGSRFCLSLL
jgi:adenine phosphoribosyltransferase